jgi:hypothetical protein
MDHIVIFNERRRTKRIHTLITSLANLPDGALIAAVGQAHVVVSSRPFYGQLTVIIS